MNSQQRRLKIYRIIYVWKILENQVSNPGVMISDLNNQVCLVKIPPLCPRSTARTRTLREASLNVQGARIFNLLLDKTQCDILEFKEKLDSFLSKIPDHPKIGNLVPASCDQNTGALVILWWTRYDSIDGSWQLL